MPICKNRSIHTQFTTIRTRFVVSLCFGRAHTEISQQITKIKWNFTNWNEYVLQQLGECTWCMPIQLLRFRFCFGFVFGFFSRNYIWFFFRFWENFPLAVEISHPKAAILNLQICPVLWSLNELICVSTNQKPKTFNSIWRRNHRRNHFMSTKFTSRKENAFHFID